LSKTKAYLTGDIIFQDKASCFPAYLLDPSQYLGDVIDTCAAPGNKTTHVAALMRSSQSSTGKNRKVFAFERNPHRSIILKKMVTRAGGDDLITVHSSKDFLTVNPNDSHFRKVETLLLDPSCSGTGIVGRDDEPKMHLPELNVTTSGGISKKRKRGTGTKEKSHPVATEASTDDNAENEVVDEDKTLEDRLRTLSSFQLQLIERAMQFPNAKRITYSTCSIHAEENEHVVMRSLASRPAQERGWRILLRHEQPTGLQTWSLRGMKEACGVDHAVDITRHHRNTPAEVAEACIRCGKGTVEGTMGFFVAAFVREGDGRIAANGNGMAEPAPSAGPSEEPDDEDEWTGFSDGD
jgi:putative methyltransferase